MPDRDIPVQVLPRLIDSKRASLIDGDLSIGALGAYLWMARQQQADRPLTVGSLQAWLERPHNVLGHDARQILSELGALRLVGSDPDQAVRLAEVAAFERLFEQPQTASPRRPVARHALSPDQDKPRIDQHAPDQDGEWHGPWPFVDATRWPPPGQNVVYLLRASNGLVIYVGSTGNFRARMKAHYSTGKRWAGWTAHPCESREEAYQVESELLQEHMPHLNVAGPRSGGAR